jgi:hypothetical protein
MNPKSAKSSSKTSNAPVHTVRLGRIQAAVWANNGDNRTFYNVTITRSYKEEGSDDWKDSDSFGRDDLPLVAKVADMAHTWIFQKLAEKSE